jgi:hypothetical protein
LLLVLVLAAVGCWPFGSSRSAEIPVPRAPEVPEPPEDTPVASPSAEESGAVELPAPPEVEPDVEPQAPVPALTAADPEVSPPPKPAPAPSRPAAPDSPPETGPPPAKPAEPPETLPRLTQFLSEEEQWEYNREIDSLLVQIHETMGALGQRPLSQEQMEVLDRVRTFVRQASEVREADLITARSLARRAMLLTQELQKSTQ